MVIYTHEVGVSPLIKMAFYQWTLHHESRRLLLSNCQVYFFLEGGKSMEKMLTESNSMAFRTLPIELLIIKIGLWHWQTDLFFPLTCVRIFSQKRSCLFLIKFCLPAERCQILKFLPLVNQWHVSATATWRAVPYLYRKWQFRILATLGNRSMHTTRDGGKDNQGLGGMHRTRFDCM